MLSRIVHHAGDNEETINKLVEYYKSVPAFEDCQYYDFQGNWLYDQEEFDRRHRTGQGQHPDVEECMRRIEGPRSSSSTSDSLRREHTKQDVDKWNRDRAREQEATDRAERDKLNNLGKMKRSDPGYREHNRRKYESRLSE